jgi:hypothetical protein
MASNIGLQPTAAGAIVWAAAAEAGRYADKTPNDLDILKMT